MSSAERATVVVELTPQGRGAIAVVLVDGPNALRAVGECFSPVSGRATEAIPINRIALGRWGGADGEELIFCRRAEQQVEIHCHGGAAAVRAVVSDLVNEGCTELDWNEWLSQQATNPISTAAHIALADAVTERTAAILLDQLNGALEAAIRTIIRDVAATNWPQASAGIDQLLSWRELGLHLTSSWRIVIAGAPNVGKSSLINALAGYERAIVSPGPGTTRDVVTVTTAIDGWPVQLADTAGFRDAKEPVESAGVQLAAAAIANADLVVLLHDATKLNDVVASDLPTAIVPASSLPSRVIHAINKVDLLAHNAIASLKITSDAIPLSALTHQGIDELISSISRSIVPSPPTPGEAVPFTVEQYERLLRAKAAIAKQGETTASAVLQAFLPDI